MNRSVYMYFSCWLKFAWTILYYGKFIHTVAYDDTCRRFEINCSVCFRCLQVYSKSISLPLATLSFNSLVFTDHGTVYCLF